MRTFTKIVSAAAALALMGTVTACGTGNNAGDDTVTISFQHQFNDVQTQAIETLVARFEEEHPSIRVNLLRNNDSAFYDALVTQILGGGGPDIVRVEPPRVPQYIASGWTLPLDDIFDPANFFPAAVEALTSPDGQLHGVPFDIDALALFYRPDMLETAGITEVPQTWEDFRTAAVAMTDGDTYGAGLFGGWGAFTFYPWLWQAGGQVLNENQTEAAFNSPEGVAALQFWVDLQNSAMPPGMATAGEDEVRGPFVAGRIGMIPSGPWAIPSLKETGIDWAVAPLPADKESATVLGGMSLLALANTSHPDQVKTFLTWLMDDENLGEYYAAVGGIPAKTSLFNDPAFANDPYVSAFQAILETARNRPTIEEAGLIDEALTEAIQAALAGTSSPQAALDAAAARVNEALND
ncbi:MAG: sugar ABC transporter substrate-binding protein [Cellulomonadaceae bacterium]|jgi:ABC-type glycerol-3-phosphate transport system substrate-binding protein|nr:sugar ABC transporter substrate-binding protein [Cellulomonadaceae bacterium]